jgi:hypothetical protein
VIVNSTAPGDLTKRVDEKELTNMKQILIILGLVTAALAQQPAKLYIKSNVPAPRTTAAFKQRCPKAVTVTNKPDESKYVLDVIARNQPVFRGIIVPSARYDAVLYNEDGESVATFADLRKPEQLAEQTCKYIESLR